MKARLRETLEGIARQEGISVNEVYRRIQGCIDAAQETDDPRIKARWALIPHKGPKVTVEEFFDYCDMVSPHSFGGFC